TTDREGRNVVPSKSVSLAEGDNTLYVLVTAEDGKTVGSYTVHIRRTPLYTVTFETSGGTAIAPVKVEEGGSVTAPATDPTRAGYAFAGWDNDFTAPVTGNLTVTANWTPNTDTAYAVEYYLQNAAGTGYDKNSTEPKTGTTGASVTAQQKAFDHFTYTATGSNPTGVIAGDGSLILKLYYVRDTYTVNFVGNGGTLKAGSANQRVRYGTAATLPTYVRNGYEFTGWENAEGYDAVVENMTITAQWRILTYTVTYELDGGTNDPANPATYQITDDVALAAPTRGEENFVGWYLPNGQKVDNLKGLYGDLTLTARWGADPDKWEKIGGELSSLDAKYRNLKIEMSTYGDAEKQSKNDLYLAGPDTVDNATRDILKLVYRRNAEANAVLGTTVEYVYWSNYGWGSQANQIKQIVYAFSSDAPDLFVNMIYDLGNATLLGCFKDVFGLNNSYFDFSCEGWMSEWMNGLSLTGDRAYILGGDYFLDIYRSMAVLPFNATMMNDYGATLAPALFGSALGAGETMTGRFYDYVEAGNWTWDALAKLSAAIWQDTDGSGQTSITDRLGIIADANSGFCAAVVLYSADVTLTENYSNNGQSWIRYPASSAALGGIFDAVSGVFGGNGALVTNGSTYSATIENPGLAYHNVKFSEDMLLFAGPRMLCALEDDVFRLMGNAVSVVPMPKISAEKEYRTLIHNVADAGAINVNTNSNKATVLSAYLQFSAEASSGIKNEYLDRYVKYSTFSYTNGTSRMLDLIYDGIASGRDKSIDDLMNTDSSIKSKRWHAIIKDHAFRWTADDLASVYQSAVTEKQSRLDDVLETWYTLPKGTGGSSGHTNHVWATDYTVDRAATCTVAGAKSIHCTSCNAIKPGSEVSIPVIAHTPSADYTVDTPDSCTTAGSKSKQCTVCNQSIPGTEVTIPDAHTPAQNYTVELPATCMYGGTKVLYCTTCHEVLDTQDIPRDPDAHVVDDWTVTKQPTLVEKGSRNGVCLLCSTHVYETLVSEPTVL
ncbi:MAG: InlB B-repeat-containing protein, partial [Clostridia bacterium]|nr:InlB B-repeat-containing protein [Clostridia bacterium]